jgi:hypothetical protein
LARLGKPQYAIALQNFWLQHLPIDDQAGNQPDMGWRPNGQPLSRSTGEAKHDAGQF